MSRIDDRLARTKKENKENHTVLGWRVTYEQDISALTKQLKETRKERDRWEEIADEGCYVQSKETDERWYCPAKDKNKALESTLAEKEAELEQAQKEIQQGLDAVQFCVGCEHRKKELIITQAKKIEGLRAEKSMADMGFVSEGAAQRIKGLEGGLEEIFNRVEAVERKYRTIPLRQIQKIAEQTLKDTKSTKDDKTKQEH